MREPAPGAASKVLIPDLAGGAEDQHATGDGVEAVVPCGGGVGKWRGHGVSMSSRTM
jgi:hypothetical protein